MKNLFDRICRRVALWTGHFAASIASWVIVAVWAASGPFFDWSEVWQLVINTGTTIITFWMVFMIQNSQNHDIQAINAKLDELIVSVAEARNEVAGIEDKTDAEIMAVKVKKPDPKPADQKPTVFHG